MKVIDSLVKIANGEEVPEYIEYYNRNSDKKDIMLVCKENIIYKLDQLEILLNDEIEIIEDKPKKIDEFVNFNTYCKDNEVKYDSDDIIENYLNYLSTSYLDTIKKVNYLLEKSD